MSSNAKAEELMRLLLAFGELKEATYKLVRARNEPENCDSLEKEAWEKVGDAQTHE